jgi:hypothetical protein
MIIYFLLKEIKYKIIIIKMNKIKIHIRNNHWKEGFLPCDLEGEKHSTITKDEFEKGLSQYPEIKDKIRISSGLG